METLEACVALNMLPGMGPVRLRALMERFGTPEAVLGAGRSDLVRVRGVGNEVADAIVRWRELADVESEMKLAEQMGVRIVTMFSDEYPERLKEIHAPPIVLYVWGKLEPRDNFGVGVVGTRKPTHYGSEAAKRLSYQIAYAGLTVFSGLARGVDTLAHKAALAAKGRTVAVLGSGLAELYPAENRELAERIADGSGAVVSEFPLRTKPDRQTFPMRNRIVAGSSAGLLVVECGRNSGALITANQALEQGRSIYAVPGPIDRPSSFGCNRLIQQGARLVMSAEDILDEMQVLLPVPPQVTHPKPEGRLTMNEEAVYEAIGSEEAHIDQIAVKCGLPMSVVSSTLLRLEMKRMVRQMPGGYFVRLI